MIELKNNPIEKINKNSQISGLKEIFKSKIFDLLSNNSNKINWEKLKQNINFDNWILLSLQELYKNAISSMPIYDDLLESTFENTWWIDVLNSQTVWLKSLEWVIDKIYSDYFWEEVDKLTDILRWSIVYDDISNLDKAINYVLNHKNVKQVYIRNRLKNPLTNDIFLNIELNNWFVCELQLHILETLHAKEKWYILTKNVIDLDNYWSLDEIDFFENNSLWNSPWRKFDQALSLPKNNQLINWHDLYKIRRSLWDSDIERNLIFKLKVLEETLNIYARGLYEKRVWKKFNY